MKNILKIFIPFLLILLLAHCAITDPDIMFAAGTVKYIPLEGGFFGIVTDFNEHLDPVNLTSEFQKDGFRISMSYKSKKDAASVHMWGKLIEIVDIRENQ